MDSAGGLSFKSIEFLKSNLPLTNDQVRIRTEMFSEPSVLPDLSNQIAFENYKSVSSVLHVVPGFVPVFAQNVNLGKKQYDSRYRCFTWNPTVFCPVPLRAVSMAPEGAAPSII